MKDFKQEAEGLFDQHVIRELSEILKITDPIDQQRFGQEIRETCADYREIISTLPCDLEEAGAPFNLSLTKRADWLETQVIKPGQRLLEALQPENLPMFSTWPYPLDRPNYSDNGRLQKKLERLIAEAAQLRVILRGQQVEDAGHSQEIRQEIFSSLVRLFRKHAPDIEPNRGTYDEAPPPEKRKRRGRYVDAMRLAFVTIIGEHENLDRLIRTEMHNPS